MDDYKDELVNNDNALISPKFIDTYAQINDFKIDQVMQKFAEEENMEEEENCEEEHYTTFDYIGFIEDEYQTIIDSLSSSDNIITTEAYNRILFFAKSRSEDVFAKLFEHDIIFTINNHYDPLCKVTVLQIVENLVKTSEEVILHFMEFELYRYIVSLVYDGSEQDTNYLVPIFSNIIDMSPMTAALFYASGPLMNSKLAFDERVEMEEYKLFLIATITNYFIRNRISQEIADQLSGSELWLKENYPQIEYDSILFRSYYAEPISLSTDSPIYTILKGFLQLELKNTNIWLSVLNSIAMLIALDSDFGLPCEENCNVIFNEFGFIARMRELIEFHRPDLAYQVMYTVAQLLSTRKTVSSAICDEVTECIQLCFKLASETGNGDLKKMSLFVCGNIVPLSPDESIVFSREHIQYLRDLLNDDTFIVKSSAAFVILEIANRQHSTKELSFEYLQNLSDIIDCLSSKQKISTLNMLSHIMTYLEDDPKSEKEFEQLAELIKRSDLYERVEEFLDEEEEDLQEAAEKFLEICRDANDFIDEFVDFFE